MRQLLQPLAARSADTTSYSPGERLIRARSSRHKHSSTSRSFSGGSDSQGEARASGDSSSPRREEITPLPAVPDEQPSLRTCTADCSLSRKKPRPRSTPSGTTARTWKRNTLLVLRRCRMF